MIMSYKMRNKTSIGNDGHVMKTGKEDGLDAIIADSHDVNIEVRIDWRNKLMSSGLSKRGIGTRKCFDNTKNFNKRVTSNTGIVTSHGTVIDTRKASDGEFKNSWCKTLTEAEKKRYKKARFVKRMMELRK